MKNRRSKPPSSEEEYEKKLQELEDFQNFLALADKFLQPEDLVKKVLGEISTRASADPLIPKQTKHLKSSKKKCQLI